MKNINRMAKLVALAVIALALGTSTLAFAQSDSVKMTADVPFDFVVYNKTFPAGSYIVNVTDHFVQIRSAASNQGAGVVTTKMDKKGTSASKLVFNCYGKERYLANVWVGGEAQGRQVTKSKAELEILAKSNASGTQEVALLRK